LLTAYGLSRAFATLQGIHTDDRSRLSSRRLDGRRVGDRTQDLRLKFTKFGSAAETLPGLRSSLITGAASRKFARGLKSKLSDRVLQLALCLVHFSNLFLNKVGKNVQNPLRWVRLVVAPTPNGHLADVEMTGSPPSLPNTTLNSKSCRPGGARRSKRDGVTVSQREDMKAPMYSCRQFSIIALGHGRLLAARSDARY
jgi:hypothetical protein